MSLFRASLKKKLGMGFTLIELLIVIAIIGILAAFMLVNFIGAQPRARDGQRKSDIRQLMSSFEMYRQDKGTYPGYGANGSTTGWAQPSILSVLTKEYIGKIPQDPLAGDNCSASNGKPYIYGTNLIKYTIYAFLENDNDPQGENFPKPTPAYLPGTTSDGYKTVVISGGTCQGVTYNYWVNSP